MYVSVALYPYLLAHAFIFRCTRMYYLILKLSCPTKMYLHLMIPSPSSSAPFFSRIKTRPCCIMSLDGERYVLPLVLACSCLLLLPLLILPLLILRLLRLTDRPFPLGPLVLSAGEGRQPVVEDAAL